MGFCGPVGLSISIKSFNNNLLMAANLKKCNQNYPLGINYSLIYLLILKGSDILSPTMELGSFSGNKRISYVIKVCVEYSHLY